jgi:FtsP/CotA-like multicopper oxidase with cupredoxin domain/peroxiredoxin
MIFFSRLTRGALWYSGICGCACFFAAASSQSFGQEKASPRVRDLIQAREKAFVHPKNISPRDAEKREVTVDLEVKMADVIVERPEEKDGKWTIKKDQLRVRTYNGRMGTTVMRAFPGDLLNVNLKNNIPKNEPPDKPEGTNTPGGFNHTNLHTHGLHVSPEGRSDNVYLDVGPGQTQAFCFDIPEKHVAGTFWFHAHRHGSAALQISSGMVGALIIDPSPNTGLDSLPEIKAIMQGGGERILVFQQLQYSLQNDNTGTVAEFDVYGTGTPTETLPAANLINGEYFPTIYLKVGEIQRWRCVHGGIDSPLDLAIGKDLGGEKLETLWDLNEIAVDGLPLYQMTSKPRTELLPGYRSDILVQAKEEGEYILGSQPISAARSLRKAAKIWTPLARVCVKGKMAPMKLPNRDDIGRFALRPIHEKELFNRIPYGLNFFAGGFPTMSFTINDQSFDRNRVDLCPRLGYAEEWALSSKADNHPFHIHVNPFEVVTKNKMGQVTSRIWRDTIFVTAIANPVENPIYVRMRFEDFPGKTVLHCHNLKHEDQGMMMAIQIVGKATLPSRCEPKKVGFERLPEKAPAWSLTDPENREHRLTELKGQPCILIFYRGFACSHCRSQLDTLAKHRKTLAKTGIKVIAVSPDSSKTIKAVLSRDRTTQSLPFLLLSDTKLDTFRRYGCHDGGVLHGTFLISAEGSVLWQHVGDEPYMDIDDLLATCNRLDMEARSPKDKGKRSDPE